MLHRCAENRKSLTNITLLLKQKKLSMHDVHASQKDSYAFITMNMHKTKKSMWLCACMPC